ncbi:MAG TPA: LPS export ABC transporter periplasmic protein LptC, partial [Gemmatimonadaceae bacterium]|nr:LPS export ABC transporter periplasmic protein LptC [Gemmatimonadaceae bacterium]
MSTIVPLSILLAVILMAGCNKQSRQPPIEKHSRLADSADQIMFGAKFTMTDNGVARALLFGDTAFFFESNTRVELENVRTTFFGSTGAKSGILTSQRGTYRTQSGLMTARGNVVVKSEDGRELHSQELNFDQTHNQIYTD